MSISHGDNYLKRAAELNALAPMFRREDEICPVTKLEQYRALDREATVLLNALYDATETSDPDELQAWFDQRVGGTDERYPGNIQRLRNVLKQLHS